MSRSTAAVFPDRNGHNDGPYKEEEKELTAAEIAEHTSIRAGINARLAELQAEAKARRSVSAVKGPRLTEKLKKAAALAKRKATLAAKAAAAAEEEEEEEEAEAETVKAEGGAGSGPAAAAAPTSSSAAAATRYAASGLPAAAKKGSVRFSNMANTRNVNRRDGRVLISDRNTRKSTAGKPVVPAVNIRRSRHAGDVSALFAKISSLTVDRDPGYLTKVLLYMNIKPHYLDTVLTAKEKEVLETPGVLAHLQKQAAMVDKE